MPRLLSPEGRAEDVPDSNVAAAMRAGYTAETGLDVLRESDSRIVADRQAARGPLDQVGAVALGVARGATFGASDVLVGDSEMTDNLRTDYATTSALSEVAGAIAPALLTGGAGAVGAVARVLPAGRAALISGRIAQGGGVARAAAAGAFEGAAQTAGHYLSNAALRDTDINAEAFIAEAGKGALIGGVVSGGLASAERGFVAARGLFPRSAGTKTAVRRAADDVDRELTKALSSSDNSVARARSQLDLMVAANPNLAAAASARVAAAKAMKAEADAAAAQGRAEMVAMRVERAKNPPPKSSRPRKGKTEPANPAYVDRGGSFDELDIIPTGKVFPGKRFDEPDLGAVDPGTVVGKKVPPGTGQAIPFPGSRVAESASAPRDLVPEYKGARLYRSPFPVVKRPEEASAFMGAPGTPTRIPIDSLSTSQGDMTISKVDNLAASPASGDLPLVFKQGDRYIIDDGNNRLAAAWKRGDTSVNVRIVELPSPAATAGDDLLALLGQSKARLDAGESIGALNAEARAAKPSAITPLHEAMAEIDPKARVVVDAVRNQERSADAIRRRFTIRDAGGTHRVALPDLEAMTIGRIKQAYKDATEIEKAAILETIGPQKAKALTDIVEGRARFDKWYKNKAHVYEDGSYNPAEAFPITRTDLEMRMPAGDAPVYDAPPNLDEPDFDLGAPSNAVEGAEAISANRAAAEISDFERSHAALADVLGPNAPPEAVELSKGVTKALAEQERKAVARMAMSADDAGRAAQMVSLPGAAGLAAAPAKRSGLLGVVGDFAAANEALQAIGIQTPFDVDKIPVVGPLLGVWAKWRAATTVLGKAGFRVPFSGETRIAGAASKTRDAMADAVDRLLARGAKAAAKTRPIAPALAWRAVDVIGDRLFDDGKRRKAETMADAMRARSEELQAAMANPAAVRSMVRDAMRDVRDPDLVDATVAVAMRKIEYLAKHAPQPPTPDMLSRSTWRPSPTDVERFARRVRAANHPIGVLEDVAAGRVTAEAAETLREVYPRLYLEAQERLIERSAELNEDLPHALVVRLSILFAVPLVRSLEPAHMAAIQAAGAPKQPAPAPPMGGVMQPPPAGAPNVSDLYMTADQRRSR